MKRSVRWTAFVLILLAAGVAVFRSGHPLHVRAQGGCSVSTLQGTYGFHMEGWIYGSDAPAAAPAPMMVNGVVMFDGAGNLTLSEVVNGQRQVGRYDFTMTYQVNPDCRGSIIPAPGSGAGPADFTAVDGGKQAFLIVTDPAVVLSGVAVRQ